MLVWYREDSVVVPPLMWSLFPLVWYVSSLLWYVSNFAKNTYHIRED